MVRQESDRPSAYRPEGEQRDVSVLPADVLPGGALAVEEAADGAADRDARQSSERAPSPAESAVRRAGCAARGP